MYVHNFWTISKHGYVYIFELFIVESNETSLVTCGSAQIYIEVYIY